MGLSLSNLWLWAGYGKPDRRILLLGLDAAGKTTLLYKMKLNEALTTIPTVGFNVESIEYRNLRMTIWDVGGQDKIRLLWRHYFQGTHGLIFMVDSDDRDRIDIAREELHKMLDDPDMKGVCVLVFANKQDLPRAMAPTEVKDKLELCRLRNEWFVQSCCATTGDGIDEGMYWLGEAVNKRASRSSR